MVDASRSKHTLIFTRSIFIVKTLEAIAYDLHKDEIPEIFKDYWDPSSKARASSILNAICTFNNGKWKIVKFSPNAYTLWQSY